MSSVGADKGPFSRLETWAGCSMSGCNYVPTVGFSGLEFSDVGGDVIEIGNGTGTGTETETGMNA